MKCQDLTANQCITETNLVSQILTEAMLLYQQLTLKDNPKTGASKY